MDQGKIIFMALVAALAIAGCNHAKAPALRADPNACGEPVAGIDSWQIAAPESVGLSKAALCPMVKWLAESRDDNVHAVLVVRHGKLVFEQYFTGDDEYANSRDCTIIAGHKPVSVARNLRRNPLYIVSSQTAAVGATTSSMNQRSK